MKKILLFASALAGLFLAGCQRENLEPVQAGQQVTFTIEAPAAMQTKAIADGQNVDQLVYEVWLTPTLGDLENGAQKLYQAVAQMVSDGTTNKAELTLDLVNDQKFTVLFWAQVAHTYDTDELTAVGYKDLDALKANDESLAAFYGVAYVDDCRNVKKDGSSASPEVILKRPFAQLNLCTLNTSTAYKVDMLESEVIVENVPTVFNVVNGVEDVNSYAKVTFDMAAVPSDPDNITVNNKTYQYAGMNYMFAGDNITLEYNIKTALNGQSEATVHNIISDVPLKENYRTNIVGNLLTSKTDFEIIVDAAFSENDYVVEGGTNYVSVSSAEELVKVVAEIAAGNEEVSNIMLNGDIDLAELVLTRSAVASNWTPVGTEEKPFTGVFDGNGHTIKNLALVESEAKEGKAFIGFFGYAKNATIKNVTFENVYIKIPCLDIDHSQGHIGAVAGSLEGTSTIENVTVKGDIQVYATQNANGASRVAVVAGGNSYGNVTMKNVHVVANEGSYLIANNNTGALAGQLQGKSVFENCSSNIDVTVNKFFAGGLVGLAPSDSKFVNCHTTGDVAVVAGREGRNHDQYRVGGIAGGWADGAKNVCTLTGCTYTGNISGKNSDGSIANPLDYAGYVGRGYTLNGCQGSKVVIDGVEYVQAFNTAAEAGVYIVNGYYEVATVADLNRLATLVNGGQPFEGITVKLVADIDLNNEEWIPIGSATQDHGFMGNFDGNGKTIKNLKMTTLPLDADSYVYAGLFGVTEGTETQENYIKDLVIENVTIDTKGHIAAAAIAYPYYTTVENITVKGNINIKGGDYTSGVLAYTRRCVNAKDLAIVGNENSVIEGNRTVGGVISDIQMNGGLTANYSNFSAEGLTIKAVQNVGGISGIISRQTLDGASVENVHIDCDHITKGIVSGALGDKNSVLTNVSYKNVTGATSVIGGTYDTGMAVVTTADELVAALEANQGVIFMNDIKIDPANMSNAYGKTGINVKNGQTIDGNGYTLNIKGAGGTWDSGINTTGGLIKNLTVTGSFRGIFINHNSDHSEKVVLENVTITGTVYTISCDQGKYQGIEATNCTFNGWTSFAKTAGEAKFVKCTFGEGNGYKYCRPYSKTEFIECTFCPGYTVDTTQAEVTFTNCINQ